MILFIYVVYDTFTFNFLVHCSLTERNVKEVNAKQKLAISKDKTYELLVLYDKNFNCTAECSEVCLIDFCTRTSTDAGMFKCFAGGRYVARGLARWVP